MTFFARWYARELRREIAEAAALYEVAPTPADQQHTQLELLNHVWARARSSVPYYRDLAIRRQLPAVWEDLAEFFDRMPVADRGTLQAEGGALYDTERAPEQWGATGGSTAEPIQLPRWNDEVRATRPNAWIGRGWYGVEPEDRLFMLWGHSHLLGSGLRGFINGHKRRVQDQLLGYHRFSAYDISPAAMQRAIEELLDFRPDYVLGYSVALDRLAREAMRRRERLHALGMKVVIATAEGFPSPESAARIEDAFGCPVAMEYGAVEALGLAYTHPSGGYRLFWRSYLAEVEPREGRHVLRLTALYPRCLPLFRYEIGDEIELGAGLEASPRGIREFDRVIGRCNDFVEMGDGSLVHSEGFSHAVRPCASVQGYQVAQRGNEVRLYFTGAQDLEPEEESGLRRRLAAIHPELEDIPVERRTELERTIAGKTPMVLRR